MADDARRAVRSAAWGVVAVVAGGGAVAAWVSATGLVWICVGVLTPVAVLALYLVFATVHGWFPAVRRWARPEQAPSERGRAAGLGAPAFAPPERAMPLQVTLEQEIWDHGRQHQGIVELRFRMKNLSGERIRLARFELISDLGNDVRARFDKSQSWTLSRELQRRRDAHGMCLQPMDLDEGDSVSRWWVQGLYLPPGVGRPRCIFRVTDGVGDTYELEIPARPPRVQRLPG